MTDLRKAAEMALEALEGALSDDKPYIKKSVEAIGFLRQALAQPEQEPDNWWDNKEYVKSRFGDSAKIVGVKHGLPKDVFKQTQPDSEHFCDTHCVHTDHHPDCELAQPEQIGFNGLTESETEQTMSVKGLSTEQRPLYFRNKETGEMCTGGFLAKHIDRWQPLYGEPPKREWVGLTAKDLAEIPPSCYEGAIWADAKLKEKNT